MERPKGSPTYSLCAWFAFELHIVSTVPTWYQRWYSHYDNHNHHPPTTITHTVPTRQRGGVCGGVHPLDGQVRHSPGIRSSVRCLSVVYPSFIRCLSVVCPLIIRLRAPSSSSSSSPYFTPTSVSSGFGLLTLILNSYPVQVLSSSTSI